MKSFLGFFKTQREGLPDSEIRELTAQFYVTLEAYFARIKCADKPRCPEAYKRVEDLLAPNAPRNWTNAYAIEQLLVHLFDEGTLAREMQVRVREAKEALRPALAAHYAETEKTTLSADDQRALLGRLVNDLQWRYTVSEVKRGYTKDITVKTSHLFILSLLVFAAAVLATLWFPSLQEVDLRLLVPAVLAGCWGAAFSMLSSLKDRLEASELDALKVLRARWVLGSRMLIGAGAASILYFFFVSGLVTGSAFPVLKPVAPGSTAPDVWLGTLAMLIVWCFIAGFSERLIPGLLAKTEARLDAPAGSERYRPDAAATNTAGASQSTPAATSAGAGKPNGAKRPLRTGATAPAGQGVTS